MSKSIEYNKRRIETLETQLELIKFMHEPRTNQELANFIGQPTVQQVNDLFRNGLENKGEIEINNVVIPINKVRYSENTFCSSGISHYERDIAVEDKEKIESRYTVHPVILPLNMTQVYILTTYILEHIEDKTIKREYRKIVDMIIPQLSDYALKRLGKTLETPKKHPQKSDVKTRKNKVEWCEEIDGYGYIMKCLNCKDPKLDFVTMHNEKGEEMIGTATLSENGEYYFKPQNSNKKYRIDTKTRKVITEE